MMIRTYLHASTAEQDTNRAKNELRTFITDFNKRMAGYYIESQSGTKLERPDLNRLIEDNESVMCC